MLSVEWRTSVSISALLEHTHARIHTHARAHTHTHTHTHTHKIKYDTVWFCCVGGLSKLTTINLSCNWLRCADDIRELAVCPNT